MTNTNLLEYLGLEKPKYSTRDLEQAQFYSGLGLDRGGVVLVKGLQGSGKTTWGVTTAWLRRKLYGYPVVSNVLLKPSFGPYTYLDTQRLVDEFVKVNEAIDKRIKGEQQSRMAGSAWEDSGVNLYKATILWDEGYGSMDRRRAMSPKLILLSYLVQMWRHFGSLIIIMTTTERLLDDIRINPFATHEVSCSFFERFSMSRYMVYYRFLPVREGLNPRTEQIFVANWGELFDSWCPVAVDGGLLRSVLREGGYEVK